MIQQLAQQLALKAAAFMVRTYRRQYGPHGEAVVAALNRDLEEARTVIKSLQAALDSLRIRLETAADIASLQQQRISELAQQVSVGRVRADLQSIDENPYDPQEDEVPE